IESNCPQVQLVADGTRLVRVMVNFLSNAIKFSPKESKIELTAVEDAGWLKVRIKDYGRGISAEDQKRIFDKYAQIEVSDATLMGGTGLGLSICKAIVEAHHGEIGVESKEGQGSTFWFNIPLKATQSA